LSKFDLKYEIKQINFKMDSSRFNDQ